MLGCFILLSQFWFRFANTFIKLIFPCFYVHEWNCFIIFLSHIVLALVLDLSDFFYIKVTLISGSALRNFSCFLIARMIFVWLPRSLFWFHSYLGLVIFWWLNLTADSIYLMIVGISGFSWVSFGHMFF